MVAPNDGAEHVKDEVSRAVALLQALTKNDPPEHPYGAVNPKALFKSKASLSYPPCPEASGSRTLSHRSYHVSVLRSSTIETPRRNTNLAFRKVSFSNVLSRGVRDAPDVRKSS